MEVIIGKKYGKKTVSRGLHMSKHYKNLASCNDMQQCNHIREKPKSSCVIRGSFSGNGLRPEK